MEKKVITESAKYLQISKINISTKSKQVSVEANGKQMQGFVSSILGLVRLQRPGFEGLSILEKSLTHHWLSFCTTDLLHCPTHQGFSPCVLSVLYTLCKKIFPCKILLTLTSVIWLLPSCSFLRNWRRHTSDQNTHWSKTLSVHPPVKKTPWRIQYCRTDLHDSVVKF
ncbi:unnamed protein product, partial [Meganyctiphanes norvegica]